MVKLQEVGPYAMYGRNTFSKEQQVVIDKAIRLVSTEDSNLLSPFMSYMQMNFVLNLLLEGKRNAAIKLRQIISYNRNLSTLDFYRVYDALMKLSPALIHEVDIEYSRSLNSSTLETLFGKVKIYDKNDKIVSSSEIFVNNFDREPEGDWTHSENGNNNLYGIDMSTYTEEELSSDKTAREARKKRLNFAVLDAIEDDKFDNEQLEILDDFILSSTNHVLDMTPDLEWHQMEEILNRLESKESYDDIIADYKYPYDHIPDEIIIPATIHKGE